MMQFHLQQELQKDKSNFEQLLAVAKIYIFLIIYVIYEIMNEKQSHFGSYILSLRTFGSVI